MSPSTGTASPTPLVPDLVRSPDQAQFASALRDFLDHAWDPGRLLGEQPPGDDDVAALWADLASRLGVAEAFVPQEYDGAGAGVAELAVVAEEFGRAMVPVPWLGTLGLAVPLLAGHDGSHPVRAELLAGICTGRTTVTAVALETSALTIDRRAGTASGLLARVVDGARADWILAVVSGVDPTLVAVRSTDAVIRSRGTLDLARTSADVALDDAPCVELGPIAPDVLRRARTVALACCASELVGVADRCLQLAVDYAGQRVQFGRVIGSYQAVKHRCARMLIELERARSWARYAAWQADFEPGEAETSALAAALFCSEVAADATADLIRVLGGTGFTWEHTAHLYFRRARSSTAPFGGTLRLRAELTERVLG